MKTPVHVDLYAAISLDGYIADIDGSTDWTKDEAQFEALSREYGCIVMGRATYDEFEGPAFDGILNLVLTHNPTGHIDKEDVRFVSSPEEAITVAAEMGYENLLVIGGADTNAAFARSLHIRSVLLDIHALFLGEGLKLFGDTKRSLELTLQSVDQKDGYMHATYSC